MFDKIFKEIEYLNKYRVEIGILAIDKERKSKDKKTTILEYAIYNEFGTKHIPARPFMRNAIDANRRDIKKLKREAIEDVIAGNITAKEALMRIGETVRGMVIMSIATAEKWAVPLSISTIRKKSKGNGFNDKPLVDTKLLIKSIRYQIIDDKGNIEYISPFKDV